jgi:hypothetical protein
MESNVTTFKFARLANMGLALIAVGAVALAALLPGVASASTISDALLISQSATCAQTVLDTVLNSDKSASVYNAAYVQMENCATPLHQVEAERDSPYQTAAFHQDTAIQAWEESLSASANSLMMMSGNWDQIALEQGNVAVEFQQIANDDVRAVTGG